MKDVKILDCTIRDGGYINNWDFDINIVQELVRSLDESGVDYIELGYRSSKSKFDQSKKGAWAHVDDNLLEKAVNFTIKSKISIMSDLDSVSDRDFSDSKESIISLVRMPVNISRVSDALSFLDKIKDKGYETALNIMGVSNANTKELESIAKIASDRGLDYLYIADSYGSMLPGDLTKVLEPFWRYGSNDYNIGFHPHNNLQMAFSNTLEAIGLGVSIVDSSVYGMGRGAGNLNTEIILAYLNNLTKSKYNAVPVLNCIDLHFIDLHKKYSWGYSLPYMLSGLLKCHPYYAKEFIDTNRLTIEETYCALLNLNKLGKSVFSHDVLSSVIEKGLYKNNVDSTVGVTKNYTVDYKNRNVGDTFLILGAGKSIDKCWKEIDKYINNNNVIVIGVNYLGDLFVPDYHAFFSKKKFIKFVNTVSKGSKLILSEHFSNKHIEKYTDRAYESVYFNDIVESFSINEKGVIQSNCFSASLLSAAIAIVMGAKNVYFAGLDGYFIDNSEKSKDFYFSEKLSSNDDAHMRKYKHNWTLKFLEEFSLYLNNKQGGEVKVITPTSYKKYFDSNILDL